MKALYTNEFAEKNRRRQELLLKKYSGNISSYEKERLIYLTQWIKDAIMQEFQYECDTDFRTELDELLKKTREEMEDTMKILKHAYRHK